MRASPQHPVARPLWTALAAVDGPATVDELARAIGAPRNSVQHRLWLWRAAGLVHRQHGNPVRYIMPNKSAPIPPSVSRDARVILRKRPARARLWSAIRSSLKTFDLPQLSLAIGGMTGSLTSYFRDLRNAGYIIELRPADPMMGTPALYRLARNTGPKPPTLGTRNDGAGRFVRCVVDRNTGDHYPLPGRPFRGHDDGGVS